MRPPPPPQLEIGDLAPGEQPAAEDVLWRAFREAPLMRWCFDASSPGYEARTRGYFRAGHDWHRGAGQPVQAARAGGELAAVAYVARPGPGGAGDDLAGLWADFERRCGSAARARFERYQRALEGAQPDLPCLTLALIAVRPELQGRGIGSALVAGLCRDLDGEPAWQGLLLDTDSAANVRFYRRFGYELRAHLHVDGLHVRVLWRPRADVAASD